MLGVHVSLALTAFWLLSCGGRAVEESSSLPDKADAAAADASDGCPSGAPEEGQSCASVGLECEYARFYCWDGRATCTNTLTWTRRTPLQCPVAFPRKSSLCESEGSCEYTLDVGCGPVSVEINCTCVDASKMWLLYGTPELCDCAAIWSPAVCELYPSECAWLESEGQCVGREN